MLKQFVNTRESAIHVRIKGWCGCYNTACSFEHLYSPQAVAKKFKIQTYSLLEENRNLCAPPVKASRNPQQK